MPAGNTFNINEYATADSFHFSEEICEQAPNLYTGNLNVYSLFTNIPLNDIIDTCIDSWYNNNNRNTPSTFMYDFANCLEIALMF